MVSVPLRGVGCFYKAGEPNENPEFPSPCGVWVVSPVIVFLLSVLAFPSPCGVWVVSSTMSGWS